jgi:arsenate reductase
MNDVKSSSVVFVCEHGTAKSVLAIAMFNEMARAKGISLRAVSRGISPDPELPPRVLQGLADDRLEIGDFTPTKFSERDLLGARLVVSFDQPAAAATAGDRVPLLAWDGCPAVSDDYAIARDAIRERVGALIEMLGADSDA